MQDQLGHSIAQATVTPWILDCDTTIKGTARTQRRCGGQLQPAQARAPQSRHAHLLDRQPAPGAERAVGAGQPAQPTHARFGLSTLLDGIPQHQRPKLVRGDCAFGSEGEMGALEAIGQPDLFKLRQSAGVKRLVQRQWARRDWARAGMRAKTCCA